MLFRGRMSFLLRTCKMPKRLIVLVRPKSEGARQKKFRRMCPLPLNSLWYHWSLLFSAIFATGVVPVRWAAVPPFSVSRIDPAVLRSVISADNGVASSLSVFFCLLSAH